MADNECKLKRVKLGVLVTVGLTGAMFLSACGARNPESAVNRYFECMKENDTEGIADYIYQESISSEEEVSMVLETGYAVLDNYLKDYIQEKAGDIEFEVLESDTEDDMSEVSIEVTYTDVRDAFNLALGDTYAEMYLSALMGVDMTDDEMEEALQSYFEEELERTGVETVTKTISIYCVKDGGSWKVIENGNLINVYTCNMYQAMQEFNEDTLEVETIDIVYGIYTRTDEEGNTITAEAGNYSDTGEDYIQIEALDGAGEQILFVSCVATSDNDEDWHHFTNSDDFWDDVVEDYVGLIVDFYEGYMTVKLADSSELGDDYSEDVYDIINGDYLYEGELTEKPAAGADIDTGDTEAEDADDSDEIEGETETVVFAGKIGTYEPSYYDDELVPGRLDLTQDEDGTIYVSVGSMDPLYDAGYFGTYECTVIDEYTLYVDMPEREDVSFTLTWSEKDDSYMTASTDDEDKFTWMDSAALLDILQCSYQYSLEFN
ncbi:MAG: hypothetical protein LUC32_07195 [Clostridiales bacterium]|nr:hypothetical protein [Clostridiales bacterium]